MFPALAGGALTTGPAGKPCPDSKDEWMLAWRMVGQGEEGILGRGNSGQRGAGAQETRKTVDTGVKGAGRSRRAL